MRPLMITFATAAFGLALGLGCDLAETLEEQPCLDAMDCWHDQACVRTSAEEAADLPGVCLPEGAECIWGEQLGCGCMPESASDCFPSRQTPAEYPEMACDPDLLVCVVASSLPPAED